MGWRGRPFAPRSPRDGWATTRLRRGVVVRADIAGVGKARGKGRRRGPGPVDFVRVFGPVVPAGDRRPRPPSRDERAGLSRRKEVPRYSREDCRRTRPPGYRTPLFCLVAVPPPSRRWPRLAPVNVCCSRCRRRRSSRLAGPRPGDGQLPPGRRVCVSSFTTYWRSASPLRDGARVGAVRAVLDRR